MRTLRNEVFIFISLASARRRHRKNVTYIYKYIILYVHLALYTIGHYSDRAADGVSYRAQLRHVINACIKSIRHSLWWWLLGGVWHVRAWFWTASKRTLNAPGAPPLPRVPSGTVEEYFAISVAVRACSRVGGRANWVIRAGETALICAVGEWASSARAELAGIENAVRLFVRITRCLGNSREPAGR